jgi:hypothetical protein
VSGTALAAGIAANQTDQEPAASALPLTCFSNGALCLLCEGLPTPHLARTTGIENL